MTGHDVVLLATGPLGERVARFLDEFLDRWPGLLAAVNNGEFQPWPSGRGLVRPDRGEVLLARDAAMLAHWDEHGYALDATGDGPVMIMYQPAAQSARRVLLLDDPFAHPLGGEFQPYQAELAVPELALLTVVLPAEEGPFPDTVLARCRAALAAGPYR